MSAQYEFTQLGKHLRDVHPLLAERDELPDDLGLDSHISLEANETSLWASAEYLQLRTSVQSPNGERINKPGDPLDKARAANHHLWFVAGYGVGRMLPAAGPLPGLTQPAIERMATLFDPRAALTSTSFSNYFDQKDKALVYHRILKKALLNVEDLLPDIMDLELRGRGGVRRAGDLLERDRMCSVWVAMPTRFPLWPCHMGTNPSSRGSPIWLDISFLRHNSQAGAGAPTRRDAGPGADR